MTGLLTRLRYRLALALMPRVAGAAKGTTNPYQGPGGGTSKAGTDKADIMAAAQLDFSNAGGASVFSGSGAPGSLVGPPAAQTNPTAGDFYLRTDTPSTSLQRLYVCTTGGASAVWSGIV